MSKLATLRLLDGDLEQGVQVVLTITILHPLEGTASQGFKTEHPVSSTEISGTLPPNACLENTIGQWQSNYRSLGATRIRPNQITYDASINQRRVACKKLDQALRSQFNSWLLSESFRPIRDKWLEQLMQDEVRVLIRTSSQSLLKLPWYLWDLIERNPLAEVALGTPDAEPIPKAKTPTLRGQVKILAILGDSTGIDVQRDRQLLEGLADAEITPLYEPQRIDINDHLWEQDWDILFFAGHSRTEGEQGRIYINSTDSLTIAELRHGLGKAIDNGLQVAIFNSCDGIGLAFELQQLHNPQTIIMREPVPDQVAHTFLTYFLPAFANGQSLYIAARQARLRLQGLEDQFPAASGLPVIFQNPAVEPPNWQELGRRPTDKCPYRGLFAFREEDALFFHGRGSFTQTLVEAIQRCELVSVIGGSGSGKSSVVFAGLVAKLHQQGNWQVVAFRPGQRPFQAFGAAWVPLKTPKQPQADQLLAVLQLAEAWFLDEAALPTAVEEARWESPGTKLLIAIDQFEELYTQCQDEQERQAFINCLLKVAELTNVALVLTLRTDFLGQALAYPPLADVLQHSNRMLGAMNRTELQAAINQPAALLGVALEEGLTDRMIEAVSVSAGNLPLLEFALQELWEKQQGTQLTHAAYNEIGGLEAAVARHAEQAYSKLNESEKEQTRQIFLQLVRPGEGTVDTRRVATRTEIGEDNWRLAARLASDRLVVTGQDALAITETVELVHEALIQEWNRLHSWIEEEREFRLWQERLRATMQQWEASKRDKGALLRGKSLAVAEDELQKRPEELAAEQEFITASLGLREREKEKLSRQRKRTIIGLTSGLVGALGLAAIAGVGWWFATNAATNERIKALVLESQELFTLSGVSEYSPYRKDFTSSKDFSPTEEQQEEKEADAKKKEIFFHEASLKAIQAGREMQHAIGVETGTRFQVLEALRQVIATQEEPATLTLPECEPMKRGFSSVAWTSDRKTIACVNYDGTVRLWDGKTGKKTNVFRGDSEWVDDVQFSPDGKIIASGTVDGTVKLWERETGKEIRVLKGHLSQVRSISFSPDGQTLAAANYDGTIIFWEVGTGRELKKLSGHSNEKNPEVDWLLFSPNGQFFVSGSRRIDGTLKLWKVSAGEEIKTIRFNDIVSYPHFMFSPDSQTFIYSDGKSMNQSVRFWNIANKKEIRNILVPGKPFISPDGQVIAVIDYKDNSSLGKGGKLFTSFTKSTVSLWDISTGKRVKILSNFPPGELSKISFSPDSSLIAVYAYDNQGGSHLGPVPGSKAKVTFWKRGGTRLKTIEQLGEVFQINFSPDGRKVAISSFGQRLEEGQYIIFKLWDVTTGSNLKTLIDEPILFSPKGLSVGLESQFSPDGRMIAAVSSSGIAKFFDSSTGAELSSPNVSPSRDISQRTSADEKLVITLRTDGSLRFRDRATGREFRMNRYDSMLVSAARIIDDKKITTVNWYGKLQQRELTTGRILRSINLPFDKSASSLKFSPDGHKVAAARSNYTVKIWDATTGKEIRTLKGYASGANEANDWRRSELHFSPNGRIVAVVRVEDITKNSALELWEVSTGKAIQFPEVISGIKNISFSPDGDKLAILKTNDTVQLWKLSTRQLEKTIRPTLDSMWGIQFSPDSESLFAFSSKELKILHISTDREIASFKLSLEAPLNPSINFSSDSKTLILQSDNKFTFLNFDLKDLLKRSCNITRDYLKNNLSVSENDRHICDSNS